MGRRKTGGYRAATKTYRGAQSGSRAQGTTGGSASSRTNNPSGGGGKGSSGGSDTSKG